MAESERLVSVMSAIMTGMKVSFSLNGKPMTYAEVFSNEGLLPAIARRADQLCSLCLGYGIGANFEDEKSTLLGVKVSFDDVTPDVLRYLCMTDVLNELVKVSPTPDSVPLDELMYD